MYKYARLTSGLKHSPAFVQATMENALCDVEDTEIFIADVGAFLDDWASHMKVIDYILRRLCGNKFTINPRKCEWAVKETDCLGYLLTLRGLEPWKKKIEAILHMNRF